MEKTETDKKLDPRVLRTRKLITQAMTELLEEKSLSAITVQDIADRATINRATFYSHYEDKFDLFTELIREMFSEKLQEHIPDEPGLTPNKIQALILALCEMQEGVLAHRSPADQQLRGMFEMEVQSQIKEQLLSWSSISANNEDAADLTLHTSLVSWGIFGTVNDWARQSKREPAADFAAKLSGLLKTDRAGSQHQAVATHT